MITEQIRKPKNMIANPKGMFPKLNHTSDKTKPKKISKGGRTFSSVNSNKPSKPRLRIKKPRNTMVVESNHLDNQVIMVIGQALK